MQKHFQQYLKSAVVGLYYFAMVTAIPLLLERFSPNLQVSTGGWWVLYLGLLFVTGAVSSVFLEKIKPAVALAAFLIPHSILFLYIAKTCQEFECILLWGAILNFIAAGGMVTAAILTKVAFNKYKKHS